MKFQVEKLFSDPTCSSIELVKEYEQFIAILETSLNFATDFMRYDRILTLSLLTNSNPTRIR